MGGEDDIVLFINILDCGYCAARDAMLAVKQMILQPSFSTSDHHFSTAKIVPSVAIAVDLSRNKQAMNRMKMSKYLRRGLYQR